MGWQIKYSVISGYRGGESPRAAHPKRVAKREIVKQWKGDFSVIVGVNTYLRELCCPPLSALCSWSLHSSQQGLLLVPFARTSTKQIRAFSVVGPSTWNGLPSELRIFDRILSPAFFLTLRLLCLTVLALGALLSSFLEEALYKCSMCMNKWMKDVEFYG